MKIDFSSLPSALPQCPDLQILAMQPWISEYDLTDGAWDFTVDIRLNRLISLSPSQIVLSVGLPLSTELRVVAEWQSTLGPLLGGRSEIYEISGLEETAEFVLELVIPGSSAGGKLKVRTLVCVGKSEFVLPGTEVWTDELELDLDRRAPRVPVAVVHFGEFPHRFVNSAAGWSIEVTDNGYSLPLSTGLQIYLNADMPEVVERISEGTEFDKRWFSYEVARSLFYRVVMDDLFELGEEYPPGSLGASLKTQITAVFPNMSIETLKRQLQTLPHEFDAVLQSQFLRG